MNVFDYPEVEALRQELLAHPIYRSLLRIESVQTFMEHHVFAVWDFMTLLKRLQRDVTCVRTPWMPPERRAAARFINEIVLGEETDEDGRGAHASHFDLYREAMVECGADTAGIDRFLGDLAAGVAPESALVRAGAPESVVRFVTSTLELAEVGKTHEVCAAFFFGREEIIPDMFQALLGGMERLGRSTGRLRYYLQRHIDVDGDSHGPLAQQLLADLCGDDATRRAEAGTAARRALKSRIGLWDGVLEAVAAGRRAAGA